MVNNQASQETKNETYKILRKAKEKNAISGRSPVTLATAALYLTSKRIDDVPLTQRKIAESGHVTEVTIRNRYQDLKKAIGGENGEDREDT